MASTIGVPRVRTASSFEKLNPGTPPVNTTSLLHQQEPSRSSRTLLILTCLPLILAVYAFLLQWSDGDPLINEGVLLTATGHEDVRLPGWHVRKGTGASTAISCNRGAIKSDAKFPHQQGWHLTTRGTSNSTRLCITVTTAAPLSQILPWMFYHKALGVHFFVLFVEGEAAKRNSTRVLRKIPGVKLIFRTPLLEHQQARSRIWNESWLSSFFYRPCNYELFVRQSLNMEMAIAYARELQADWILHIDTDELLYPAGYSEYSLQKLLGDVPPNVDNVVFPNYESAVESDSIVDPFSEVTMFKKNYDHMAKEVYFGHYREATRSNPNYFLTYGNGKSAARVVPHLRPNGAHRWHNYAKPPNEVKLEEAAVLHYTYAKFSDLTSRRDRCGCKPNPQDVKKCFMLDFDRVAFIIASTQSEEGMLTWYREHVVWTDETLNQKLLKKGLLGRIYTPQIVIRGIIASGIIEATIARGQQNSSRNGGKSTTSVGRLSNGEVSLNDTPSLSQVAKEEQLSEINETQKSILEANLMKVTKTQKNVSNVAHNSTGKDKSRKGTWVNGKARIAKSYLKKGMEKIQDFAVNAVSLHASRKNKFEGRKLSYDDSDRSGSSIAVPPLPSPSL